MQNRTVFDLDGAIGQWRKNLALAPALSQQNLDELESHLRDSVLELHHRGISEEEAFVIAVRRIGSQDAIGREFEKVNGNQLWRVRATWMLAGMLFALAGIGICNICGMALLYFGAKLGLGGGGLGGFGIAGSCFGLMVMAMSFWLIAKGTLSRDVNRIPQWAMHPGILIAVSASVIVLLKSLPGILVSLAIHNIPADQLGFSLMMTSSFAQFIEPLLIGALIAFALMRLSKQRFLKAGAIAVISLMLPLATTQSARAQTSSPMAVVQSTNQVHQGTLPRAMELWKNQKKEAAVQEFFLTDFSNRPLFSRGSVLNYSEAQFIALPQAAREKLSKAMIEDLDVLKKIAVEVQKTRKDALARGDSAKATLCAEQLRACGDAFNRPDSLALLKLVGKAFQKMALSVPAAEK